MVPTIITALDTVSMISIEDCRKHLRLTDDGNSPPAHYDDDLVLGLLSAAREFVEGYTGLALTPRTLEIQLDKFPLNEIMLPVAPLVSLVSVKYLDEDNIQQTVLNTDCVLDTFQRPGWLLPAVGITWPSALDVVNAVAIRYNVGFSLRTDAQTLPLPKTLRVSVLLLLGHLYENREQSTEASLQEIPLGIQSLCDLYKIRKGLA
jgi:uncharacterized phiE125 gp8 family phage protein